jgi:solute carrier family 35 (UDP-galactose transporter), member B1
LAVLASSLKLLPILLASVFVRGKWPSKMEAICSTVMTSGVVIYSFYKEKSGQSGHHSHPSDSSTTTLLFGLGLILINLCLEGLTNAYQDKLFGPATAAAPTTTTSTSAVVSANVKGSSKEQKQEEVVHFTPSALMMAMNLWSVVLTTAYLGSEGIVKATGGLLGDNKGGEPWVVPYFFDFARRHPEMLIHMLGFSLLGALAQTFIFETLKYYGSLATASITVSRKFLTVLLSVAIFQHKLRWQQWVGVVMVFVGLALSIMDKHKKGHGHGHGHGEAAAAPAPARLPGILSSPKATDAVASASASLNAMTPNVLLLSPSTTSTTTTSAASARRRKGPETSGGAASNKAGRTRSRSGSRSRQGGSSTVKSKSS